MLFSSSRWSVKRLGERRRRQWYLGGGGGGRKRMIFLAALALALVLVLLVLLVLFLRSVSVAYSPMIEWHIGRHGATLSESPCHPAPRRLGRTTRIYGAIVVPN